MKKIYLLGLLLGICFCLKGQVKIYEVYGGGGNSGAPYNADYVVLINPTNMPVSLAGWSLQYASSNGTSWDRVGLSGIIAANGGFFLVKVSTTGATGAALPTPDVDATSFNMAATAGKIVLMNNNTTITMGTSNPTTLPNYVDFVGYGTTANAAEGSPAPTPSNATAIKRAGNNTTQDTNNNSVDFITATPTPRNSGSPLPVRLLTFQSEATQEGISLSWQTSEETNNSHFEVERSSDARSFEAIGRIDGRGNSTENQSYTFTDLAPRLGLNYYRLKQVDFDGASEYSRMIVAQYNGSGTFRVYPNPTADFIAVELPENTEAKSYQLKDLYGRVVSTFTKSDAISLKHLVPSMYHLEVLTVDGKRFYQKILIQR